MTSTEPRERAAGAAPAGTPLARSRGEHDALAALEEERDFLLRSLDDLEREHDAGDVDDTDYVTLRDDYTARAAAVIRSIEARQSRTEPPRARRSWGRTFAWVAAIAVFAVLAGVLVAQMSGSRRDGETASGDIRDNTRQLLVDAMSAAQNQRYDDAIDLYDQALELSPSNAEALAYRGWTRYRKGGDDAAATADIDAAIAADPSLPDARVFKTVLLTESGDFTAAAEQLKTFDSLNPPSLMTQLVAQFALRERIVAGVLLADGAPGYADAGFTTDEVLAAARYTFGSAPVEALGLVQQVLAAEPSNADAHADLGYLLALAAKSANDDAQLRDRGMSEIDAALALEPQNAAALAYKASVLLYLDDDAAGAKAALDAYDAAPDKPTYVTQLVEGSSAGNPSLRQSIESAATGG
jgi:tetratricopeptide (TPR) repeat protein